MKKKKPDRLQPFLNQGGYCNKALLKFFSYEELKTTAQVSKKFNEVAQAEIESRLYANLKKFIATCDAKEGEDLRVAYSKYLTTSFSHGSDFKNLCATVDDVLQVYLQRAHERINLQNWSYLFAEPFELLLKPFAMEKKLNPGSALKLQQLRKIVNQKLGTYIRISYDSKEIAKNVVTLMQHGADCHNMEADQKWSALEFAILHKPNHVLPAMLKEGVDVNYARDEKTLLMLAASHNRPKSVDVLLKAGAEVDRYFPTKETKYSYRKTALYYALATCASEIAIKLVQAGADFSRVDKRGNTLLVFATQNFCCDFMVSVMEAHQVTLQHQNKYIEAAMKFAVADKNDSVQQSSKEYVIEQLFEESKEFEDQHFDTTELARELNSTCYLYDTEKEELLAEEEDEEGVLDQARLDRIDDQFNKEVVSLIQNSHFYYPSSKYKSSI